MCMQTDEELAQKLAIADDNLSYEIASCLIIALFTIYARNSTKALAASYDKTNVTPSDYTLFFRIEPDQNHAFDSKVYDPSSKESRGSQMVALIRRWLGE